MNRTIYIGKTARVYTIPRFKYYQEILYIDIDVTNPEKGEFEMERVYNRIEYWEADIKDVCGEMQRKWKMAYNDENDRDYDITKDSDKTQAVYRRIIEKHIEAITAQEIEDYFRTMQAHE